MPVFAETGSDAGLGVLRPPRLVLGLPETEDINEKRNLAEKRVDHKRADNDQRDNQEGEQCQHSRIVDPSRFLATAWPPIEKDPASAKAKRGQAYCGSVLRDTT